MDLFLKGRKSIWTSQHRKMFNISLMGKFYYNPFYRFLKNEFFESLQKIKILQKAEDNSIYQQKTVSKLLGVTQFKQSIFG